MKFPPLLCAFLSLACTALPSLAQTSFDTEFSQLKEQRVKAIATMVGPIDRRYQASLEQLLRRATQNGDLDSALKIKDELAKVALALASNPGAEPTLGTPVELIGLWDLNDVSINIHQQREFKPGGKMIINGTVEGGWKIEGNKLILTYPEKENGDYFELPIRDHQLTGITKLLHKLVLTKLPPK